MPLKDDDVTKAASHGSAAFGKVIEQVQSDQDGKSKTLAGNFGKFMGNVYPIAEVVLGILSFSGVVRYLDSSLGIDCADG